MPSGRNYVSTLHLQAYHQCRYHRVRPGLFGNICLPSQCNGRESGLKAYAFGLDGSTFFPVPSKFDGPRTGNDLSGFFFYNFGTGTCTSDPRRLIFGQIILMGSGICRQLNWKNLAKRQKQKTIYFKIVGSKRRIWVQLGR